MARQPGPKVYGPYDGQFVAVARRKGETRQRRCPRGMSKAEAYETVAMPLWQELVAEQDSRPAAGSLGAYIVTSYVPQSGLGPSTWRARRSIVIRIAEHLGHHRLDKVTTSIVRAWRQRLEGEGLKRWTIRSHVIALSAIYRHAIEAGAVEQKPWHLPVGPQPTPAEKEPLTEAQEAAMLELFDELAPDLATLARFLLLTGVRPVEALRLRWSDVRELPKRVLRIQGKPRPTVKRNPDDPEYRIRWLPWQRGDLRRFIDGLERGAPEAFVFVEAERVRHYWRGTRWGNLMAEAGLPTGAYVLRHGFATSKIREGHELAKLAKWLGNSPDVLWRNYQHLLPEDLEPIGGGGADEAEEL